MSILAWNTFSTIRGSLRDENKFDMGVTIKIAIKELTIKVTV